jgi:hypothetical protein
MQLQCHPKRRRAFKRERGQVTTGDILKCTTIGR